MFSIGPRGALTAVPGSPFATGGQYFGGDASVDFNSSGDLLFGGEWSFNISVDVFGVGCKGALSPVAGSPFTFDSASGSMVVLSDPSHLLFVSNLGSSSVTDFIGSPKGVLTPGVNQPVNLGAGEPTGMAVNTIQTPTGRRVTLLYVADYEYSQVFGFEVDRDGTLTAVPGSPFPTGEGEYTGLMSLAVDSPADE